MVDLLIDADMYLYQAASAVEVETKWDDDIWTLHSCPDEARRVFDAKIDRFRDHLNAANCVLCFSDPTRKTFRHDLYPAYKQGRGRKPLAYAALRDAILATEKCVVKPKLEADDVMGIITTRVPGKLIIVSGDKDMQSIPGLLYNDRTDKLVEISVAQADRYHLIQTLTGDATDNYSGCPGVGPVTAEKAVKDGWEGVVKAFKKVGLTEEDALLQARLARILRASDWDFEKSEVKLWLPSAPTLP